MLKERIYPFLVNLKVKRRPSENSYSSGGWRKYSGQSKGSFDSSYKGSNGYPRKYKTERFNSEVSIRILINLIWFNLQKRK